MPNPITECSFLHCEAEEPLIVVHEYFDRQWGLCSFHDQIVEKNGVSMEYEDGKAYLFSPVMLRGNHL